jgi:hypothetical protein
MSLSMLRTQNTGSAGGKTAEKLANGTNLKDIREIWQAAK